MNCGKQSLNGNRSIRLNQSKDQNCSMETFLVSFLHRFCLYRAEMKRILQQGGFCGWLIGFLWEWMNSMKTCRSQNIVTTLPRFFPHFFLLFQSQTHDLVTRKQHQEHSIPGSNRELNGPFVLTTYLSTDINTISDLSKSSTIDLPCRLKLTSQFVPMVKVVLSKTTQEAVSLLLQMSLERRGKETQLIETTRQHMVATEVWLTDESLRQEYWQLAESQKPPPAQTDLSLEETQVTGWVCRWLIPDQQQVCLLCCQPAVTHTQLHKISREQTRPGSRNTQTLQPSSLKEDFYIKMECMF